MKTMEDVKEKKIKIARTRNGVPCLWESLMSFSDLKRATVIYGKDKEVKNAVFVNQEREKQALVPIQIGDFISKAFEDKHGVALSVFRIDEISPMENVATITPVYRKSSLISEYVIDKEYKEMVEATIEKLEDKRIIAKPTKERVLDEKES
jgi:hypothetical protein